MTISEAETQILASIQEALSKGLTASRQRLEERSDRFWIFKQDWHDAFSSLQKARLIEGDQDSYQLTETGRPLAVKYHAERPDLYWYYYQQFYDLAERSKVHSRFCERVFGEDRCQEGQTDMACFNDLLSRMNITDGDHLLDLGCGAGGLSEYIFDKFGASVTGIDFSASAIRAATTRTQNNANNLKFLQADLNSLELPANTYDAAISIDSVYWVADMDKTVSSIIETIKPGGQLCILIEHTVSEDDDKALLDSKHTDVAKSLDNLGLSYATVDYTELFMKFWPIVKQTAQSLREDYLAEGTELICDNWIREANDDYLPHVEANLIRRYLYQVHI